MSHTKGLEILTCCVSLVIFCVGCDNAKFSETTDKPSALTTTEKGEYQPTIVVINGKEYLKDLEIGSLYLRNPNRSIHSGDEVQSATSGLVAWSDSNATMLKSELAKSSIRHLWSSGTDASGKISMATWYCYDSASREINTGVSCDVDPDYVLVGGGGFASWDEPAPGALLTEIRPLDWGLVSYVSSSKSHGQSSPHSLFTFAIGIKIQGLTRSQLFSYMNFQSTPYSATVGSPSNSIAPPRYYLMVGGGSRVEWTGYGNLLTNSSNDAGRSWNSASKDHLVSSTARVATYIISISEFMPVGRVTTKTYVHIGPSTSGKDGRTTAHEIDGYVLTCPGGKAAYTSGPGRMLYGVYPTNNDAVANTKDHIQGSSGTTTVTAIKIKML